MRPSLLTVAAIALMAQGGHAVLGSAPVSDRRPYRQPQIRCIYREKAASASRTGRSSRRPTGDVLVLSEWDRCTRSMTDGIAIIERVHKRGASVKALDRDCLDLTKPINRVILASYPTAQTRWTRC